MLKKSVFLIIFYKPKTVPVNWVFVKSKPKPAFSKNLTGNPLTIPKSRIVRFFTSKHFFSPMLLATAAEQFGYELMYPEYFGGVVALSWDHFHQINGYPNR